MATATMAASSRGLRDEPPAKRSKPTRDNDDCDADARTGEHITSPSALAAAWEHYRNYIDGDASEEEDACDGGGDDANADAAEGGGDVDELLELIDILSAQKIAPLTTDPSTLDVEGASANLFGKLEKLLAILLSMAHLQLANYAISEKMFDPHQPADPTTCSNDEEDTSSPEYHFGQSLSYWPTNPAALSLLANYQRMNALASLESICEHYQKAAGYARHWRTVGLEFLQSECDGELECGMNAKEWVELLVVNGALDVDCIGDDDEEEEDEDQDDDAQNQREEGAEGKGEEYSCSEVESTASFMAAFLLSTLGKHEEALPYLQKFGLSHRIHPNVWREAMSIHRDDGSAQTNEKESACRDGKSTERPSAKFPPRMYHGASAENGNGVLPLHLYQRLCNLFAPNAPYWKESDYNNRGYYSYFIDLDAKSNSSPSVRERPTNVIEDAIVNHLLPLAERTLKDNDNSTSQRIVGAEWWVHTRPLGANLGHQVHFDTDESLLSREKVTHPIVSSVMYLTGACEDGASAGATVVFDQTPDATEVASRVWIAHPRNNAFMNFSGDFLHGVLPCAGSGSKKNDKKSDDDSERHRLTFMVGFWTRNVAEGMGERGLYSPSGPLPPATSEHSWVAESQQGYDAKQNSSDGGEGVRGDLSFRLLPSTSPAWEQFDSKTDDNAPVLVIPKGLDHRFFVRGAPHCFSESLFDKDDCF